MYDYLEVSVELPLIPEVINHVMDNLSDWRWDHREMVVTIRCQVSDMLRYQSKNGSVKWTSTPISVVDGLGKYMVSI